MGGLYWMPKKTFKKPVWSYIFTNISVLPNNSINIRFMALNFLKTSFLQFMSLQTESLPLLPLSCSAKPKITETNQFLKVL